jgi:hypothetical protein
MYRSNLSRKYWSQSIPQALRHSATQPADHNKNNFHCISDLHGENSEPLLTIMLQKYFVIQFMNEDRGLLM